MLEQGYGIMPNAVLYSTELTDKQKLLFCTVSSLCAKEGFCWATNEYLGELLNADKRTISRNMTALEEKGYITIEICSNSKRKITLDKNDMGDRQKCLGGIDKNVYPYIYMNNTNEYYIPFETFWNEYPHARKGKKSESKKYYDKLDSEEVMKQVHILKRKIRAGLQDGQFIPACERWIRDFTPINEDVVKQDLVKICKRHLNAGGDMKERSLELKQTFGDEQINSIVKAIQQKDSPKNLFTKQN